MITVDPVNDAPAFTSGADPVALEDAGPQTITGWASAIRPGPPDEASQAVTFAAMNSNNLLFAAGGQPLVAANGTLTFTPAANASGIATVTVEAVDTGGTTNGGSDTSTTSSITISVTAQPDPPLAASDAMSVNEDDPAGVTFDVLANDSDPDGDPLTLSAFDATAVTSGQLIQNSGGNFTYIPGPAFSGSETFTYTLADGTGATATGTATITTIAQPDSPVAGADAYTTAQATPLMIAAPGLLNNDYDEDGDPLTVNSSLVLGPATGSRSSPQTAPSSTPRIRSLSAQTASPTRSVTEPGVAQQESPLSPSTRQSRPRFSTSSPQAPPPTSGTSVPAHLPPHHRFPTQIQTATPDLRSNTPTARKRSPTASNTNFGGMSFPARSN